MMTDLVIGNGNYGAPWEIYFHVMFYITTIAAIVVGAGWMILGTVVVMFIYIDLADVFSHGLRNMERILLEAAEVPLLLDEPLDPNIERWDF